ncbi:protein NinF [Pantoea dispersa]|uniref:protein NinF n=1 Tax=Pantoea dispersa TaxID=59814 RepID=UPI0032F00572
MKNGNDIGQLNQPTGAGEPSALACAGCGSELPPYWVYACDQCCAGWMENENNRMHGDNDD